MMYRIDEIFRPATSRAYNIICTARIASRYYMKYRRRHDLFIVLIRRRISSLYEPVPAQSVYYDVIGIIR